MQPSCWRAAGSAGAYSVRAGTFSVTTAGGPSAVLDGAGDPLAPIAGVRPPGRLEAAAGRIAKEEGVEEENEDVSNPTKTMSTRDRLLLEAIEKGETAGRIRKLIKGGAAINGMASDGRTPLIAAADQGREDLVRVLLLAHLHPRPRPRPRPHLHLHLHLRFRMRL